MRIKKNIAISDSGFLFNPSTGDSYTINPIGQEILALMKEGVSEDDIKKHLLEHYATDETTIEKDLYDFGRLLGTYKLIEEDGQA